MATVLGTLLVKLGADVTKFQQSMGRVQDKLKSVQDQAGKVAAVSGAAFVGMAAGIGLAIKASSEQRKAELKFAAAAQASAEAIDVERFKEFAAQFQDLTGVADEATLAQSSFLVALGLTQDQVESAVPALSDFAQVTGKSLPRLMRTLGSALEGTASTLASMGLVLSETEKQAFNAGSRMEKTNLIIEAMGRAAPGLTAALKSTATGGFAAMTGRVGDFLEQIGFMFDLPIGGFFNKMEGVITKVTKAIEGLDDDTKQWIVRGTALGGAILGISAAVSGLIFVLPTLIPLITAVALPMLTVAAVITGVILAIGLLRIAWEKDLGGMRTELTKFAQNVMFEFNELSKNIDKIIGELEETFQVFIAFVTGATPEEAFKSVQRVRKQRAAGEAGPLEAAAVATKEVATDVAREAAELFKKVGGVLGDALKEGIDPLFDALGIDLDKVGKSLGDFGKNTGGAADNVARGFEGLDKIIEKVLSSGDLMSDKFAKMADETEAFANSMPGLIDKMGGSLVAGTRELFSNISPEIGAAAAQAVDAAFRILAPVIQSAGETTGAVLQGAISGAEAGPIGALIGAIVGLLTQVQAFKDILTIGEQTFGFLVKTLQTFLKPLVPLVIELAKLVEVTNRMGLEVSGLKGVFEFVGPAIEGLAEGVKAIMKSIRAVWNKAIEFIANILEQIPKIGDDLAAGLRRSKIKAGDITKFLAEEIEPSTDELDDLGDSLRGVNSGFEELSDAMNEATASLTNVPRGFKVALRRFEAIAPSAAKQVLPSGAAFGEQRPAANVVNIREMNVDTTDAEGFAEMVRSAKDFADFAMTGSSKAGIGPFAVEKKGA
jgi:archaellum component FlaC